MAYENVYGTDEDIEKYKLNEVWDRYYYGDWEKENRFWGKRPELTIDRERDVFMFAEVVGPTSDGTQYKFLLSIQGNEAFIFLNLGSDSTGDFSERPFYRVWEFVKVKKSPDCKIQESEILSELKKALTIFGYWGIRKQIPETIVKFEF